MDSNLGARDRNDLPHGGGAEGQSLLRRATANCIRLYRATLCGEPWSESLRQAVDILRAVLARIWGGLARTYAARMRGWEADSANPGYLVCRAQHAEVRVPYHLAPDFPVGQILEDLTDLALEVRASDRGVICLSGSSTFWEALRFVADVDFCEYVPLAGSPGEHAELGAQLLARSSVESTRVFCTCTRAYDRKGSLQSLDDLNDQVTIFRAQLNFLALLTDNVLEATSLVLPIRRDDPADPALELSFPLQEAPVVDGSWVPRDLLDPLSIGRYADWLQSNVNEKLNSAPIKAAKRGISLARITGYDDHGNRLISLLQSGTELIDVALEAREALLPAINNLVQSRPEIGESLLKTFGVTTERLKAEARARRGQLDISDGRPNNQDVVSLKNALVLLLQDVSNAIEGASRARS